MFKKNKHKFRTLVKRVVSTAAAVTMLVTSSVVSTFAAEVKYDWDSSDNPVFTRSFTAVNGGVGSITAYKSKMVPFKVTGEKYYAMCVLPGTAFSSQYRDIDGVIVVPNMDEYGNYWENWYRDNNGEWENEISDEQRKFIALCTYYGYPNAKESLSYFYATQALSWEIVMGYRTCDDENSNSFKNSYNGIKLRDSLSFKSSSAQSAFKKSYDDIENKVSLHHTRPSSMQKTETLAERNPISMTYDWKTMKYSATFSVENEYLDSSMPSNFRELFHDIPKAGFEYTYTKGSKNTKFTVTTNEYFSGKKTISTVRRLDDLNSGCEAKIYKKYGDQTLLKGGVKPDYNSAHITFQIANQPNLWLEKSYRTADSELLVGAELEDALEQTRFRIRKTVDGIKYYVVADYDSERDMYVFSSFTDNAKEATAFHTLRTEENKGRFALLNLPSKANASVSYKVEEIATADGYGTASATFTVPPYTDPTTQTVRLVNNGAAYGSVDMTKVMLDESGDNYDVSDYQTALEMQQNYKSTAFIAAVMTDDGLKYLTSSALTKNVDVTPNHVLYGTGAEQFSAYDGRYYAWVSQSGNEQQVEFEDMCLSTDISDAKLIYPGWEISETDGSFTPCEYFGGIHIECMPTDKDGCTVPIMFIEVGHAENFGYDESCGDGSENAVSIADVSKMSATEFSSFDGLVKFPAGTTCEDGIKIYELSDKSYYPAATAATDKTDGQNRYADTTISNKYYHLDVVVIKTDGDTSVPVANAIYGLYSKKNNSDSLLDTAVTDSEGKAKFGISVKAGSIYYVHEIEAPAGYALDNGWYSVSSDPHTDRNIIINSYIGEHRSELADEPYKLAIELNKTDADYGIPVSGAEFDIITNQPLSEKETAKISDHDFAGKAYSAGDVVGTVTTDENGKAEYYGLPLGGANAETGNFNYTYSLVERSVPAPYVLDSTPFEIVTSLSDISADETAEKSIALAAQTAEITNKLQSVKLTAVKTNDSGTPIEGVKFDVYTAEDIVIGGVTVFEADTLIGSMSPTDKDGKAYSVYTIEDKESMTGTSEYSVPLYSGFKYKLVEDVTSVPEYYEPLSEPVEFTSEYGGMELETVELAKNIVNYEKSGTVEVHKTTEGMLNLSGISFTLSGTSDAGTEVNITAATDENGLALFEHIPIGTYTVTEDNSSTPYAYLTAEPVEVEVFYAQTTVHEIHNDEKTGTIEIHKTTEGMMNLEGISFTLSGTSDSGRDISITATTDENGKATFENIPIGTYTVTEVGSTTPTAYMVADPVEVEVYYAETTTQEIHNDEKTGTFEVHKTTEGMTDLEGISFVLSGTSDSGRDISITAVTDKNGIATFENIPIGTYTITEVKSTVPAGYLVADAASIEVFYAETTTAEIFNDTTKVKVSKQDITTGKELSGAHLEVIDKDGKIVEEWISANEPHMIEGKLEAGEEYTLRETIAPDGYRIATDIKFTVAEDGSVQTVIMHDELIPSTPDIPSTPSTPTTPNPSTGSAAALGAVVLVLGVIAVLSNKKKD